MRTCDVYKSMFFKMDASFKTSVKARKLSGSGWYLAGLPMEHNAKVD